jgi:hypothetical protein
MTMIKERPNQLLRLAENMHSLPPGAKYALFNEKMHVLERNNVGHDSRFIGHTRGLVNSRYQFYGNVFFSTLMDMNELTAITHQSISYHNDGIVVKDITKDEEESQILELKKEYRTTLSPLLKLFTEYDQEMGDWFSHY